MKPLYIVAVSGGVDSMVLLDQLVRADEARLVVAHVDHGMRPSSSQDAAFVQAAATAYGVPCESTRFELGPDASEERAREMRWKFLRQIREQYRAAKIVTAHHMDDVAETMIINMLRGTGWRGIASLIETDTIRRPLLNMRKSDIVAYARAHNLQWREDSSNRDTKYLRNHVRHEMLTKCSAEQFAALLQLHERQVELRREIDREVNAISPPLSRYEYIMWPDGVAYEMLRRHIGVLTRRELSRIIVFIRVARHHTRLRVTNGKVMEMGVKQFIVLGGQDC